MDDDISGAAAAAADEKETTSNAGTWMMQLQGETKWDGRCV